MKKKRRFVHNRRNVEQNKTMKLNKLLFLCSLLGILMASCIKDEALNTEADIETCDVLLPAEGIDDILIENRKVTIFVEPSTDVSRMKLDFTLTPGATIEPPSGTIRDFTTPKIYTVTSEDRQWEKQYTVSTANISNIPTEFDFEYTKLYEDKYYIFYEKLPNGTEQAIWASGNGGFNIAAFGKEPEAYPTIPFADGKSGKCAKLETKSTGLGVMVKMPIAAGNLFLGKFIATNAMLKPLEATQFGASFDFEPVALKGYYKYKAGAVVTDKYGKEVPNEKDNFDIYAIIFDPSASESEPYTPYLDGNNQLTSSRIISMARIKEEDRKEINEWTEFNLPFELKPGKTLDKEKLEKGEYRISIVFSSSIYGDEFRGAVGSTLFIDEVRLITEN